MPELPELEVARERLGEALGGRRIVRAAALDPFLLRTVEPPLSAVVGARVTGARRRGKHLLLDVERGLSLAFHLMRAGRLRLKDARKFKPHRKRTLFVLEVEGALLLEMTEAGTERRATLRVLRADALPPDLDRGIEPMGGELTVGALGAALRAENRRVKNALRSPDVVAGVGNAYSDEILHAARLSPMRETRRMTDEEMARLAGAIVATLGTWIERVRAACPPGTLPEKQDLWRKDFRVHGKAGQTCPVCGATIERISYVDAETDYCPTCQTGGRLLADRRLSRLGIRRSAGSRTLAGDGVPCESSPLDAAGSPPKEDRWATPRRPKPRKPRARPKGPDSSRDAGG
ncbi:MAG: DNA-formamidopyrimidine glycosylase family protein [bacterium]